MVISGLRRSFISRRWGHRLFFDFPDFIARALTGRGHWPPYSLRSFVGGADYDEAGRWFLKEFQGLGLLRPGARILDIGCGCGRVAYALATAEAVREAGIQYDGMDIDRANVEWCQRHITPQNGCFRFYQADCYNPSYNPNGREAATTYRFPFAGETFSFILLTSVFTHVLEDELRHYLAEAARLLAPGGTVYATFFLCESLDEVKQGLARHQGLTFHFECGHAAVARQDYPTHAVAYREAFVREMALECGLRVIEPTRYGVQDVVLFTGNPSDAARKLS